MTRRFRPHPARRRAAASSLLAILTVVLLLGLKVVNYASPGTLRPVSLRADARHLKTAFESWTRNTAAFHSCPASETKQSVDGGFICTRQPLSQDAYDVIFRTYPIDGGAREAIYPSDISADQSAADAMLHWQILLPRYSAVQVSAATNLGEMDQPGAYWNFEYYSMRLSTALVDAYAKSGQQRYLDRLWRLDDDFFATSAPDSPMWSDPHAVAFRSMALTYQWWKLRRYHALDDARSRQILQELTREGDYLQDPNHYQPNMNHGPNESAALLLLGYSFPNLPHAAAWQRLATVRVAQALDQLIDADGVLIENSPYYHMYELEKMWQIFTFGQALHIKISNDFTTKLQAMIGYATYMLQPDGSVPLLGASLERTIRNSGIFADIAATNPNFLYVLTQGRDGTPPPKQSIYFPAAGQTFLRSGWDKGGAFTSSAYLTFNVGAYRTSHSQLDLLGISLFGEGHSLLTPPGLYSYTPGPMRSYFQGSASHNVVVVDGKDQAKGSAQATKLQTVNGITYQSAATSAYNGVDDARTVAMLDKDHFLVVDRLSSRTTHHYQQMWHLFQGAQVHLDGLTSTAVGKEGQRVTITQLDPSPTTLTHVSGQQQPAAGLCSSQYEVADSCEQLAYAQVGKTASFATLISVGASRSDFSAQFDPTENVITVSSDRGLARLTISSIKGSPLLVRSRPQVAPQLDAKAMEMPSVGSWKLNPTGDLAAARSDGHEVLRLASRGGSATATAQISKTDLSGLNIQIRFRLNYISQVSRASLELTSDGGRSFWRFRLSDIYDKRWDGEWVTLSLPKTSVSSGHGTWQPLSAAAPLHWNSINGLRLEIDAKPHATQQPSLEVESLSLIQEQQKGAVSIVFDDGYESILPAAEYLKANKMPASIAVIGRATELPTKGYLNVFQLHELQDVYGWNVVNHTQRHVDAVSGYDAHQAYDSYAKDVVDGALWLQRAGLNSAPNWFIYPHGTTNDQLDRVVSQFYTFARTTVPGAEVYPFGSPLRVRTLELFSPQDSSDGSATTLTRPEVAARAVADAKKYRTTLIITLHRIQSTTTDRPGYSLSDFKQVVDAIKASGLPVVTLSQLDEMNGVPESSGIDVTEPLLPMEKLTVTWRPTVEPPASLWSRITGWL